MREIDGQICGGLCRPLEPVDQEALLLELIHEQEMGQAGIKQWAAETGSPAPASCLLCVCSARGCDPRSLSGKQLEWWPHATGPACTRA